jgi:ribosome-binding protein aMBF1 (putative translation factor)
MKAIRENNLVSSDDHLDKNYGKAGTPSREKYEEEFENYKIGTLIQEARKQLNLIQEEFALKCGTTKNYISRIKNNASDIRFSTLMRKIREGFGGHLKLSLEI